MLPSSKLVPPEHPILRNSAPVRLTPLIGLMPFTITVFGLVAGRVSGAEAGELILPFAAMTGMSIMISLLLGTVAAVATFVEAARIRSLYRNPLGYWPQYSTDRQWEKQVEDSWEATRKASQFEWPGLIVVTIIFVGISIWVLVQFGMPYVLIAIGGMYLIVLTIMIGGKMVRRAQGNAAYRRGRSTPRPSLILGRQGMYHEGEGLTSFGGLQSVEWIAPDQVSKRLTELNRDYLETGIVGGALERQLAGSGWGLLAFTMRRRVRHWNYTETALARVPPEAAAEAQTIAAQFSS